MPDRFALPLIALLATGLIVLAMIWPQGQGALSPPPFGHKLGPVIPEALSAKLQPKPAAHP